MADNNYFDNLMSTLSQRQIPANKIELEITEQVLMDKRTESVFDTFMNLREKGVYISLDDFGTGYASLMHLSKCPIHAIKLDKSFISGINKNKETSHIDSILAALEMLRFTYNRRDERRAAGERPSSGLRRRVRM